MELSIDTSTRYASVALSQDGAVQVELTWRSERNHSVELVPSVRQLLARLGKEVSDLSAIFVAKGPGSFSALRVGMSTAKTLAVSLNAPLVAVGTLDIEAQPYFGLKMPVRAVIGAGRDRLYVGKFQNDAAEYGVMNFNEFKSDIDEGMIVCGEGAAAVAPAIKEKFADRIALADVPPPTRRAGVLATLGYGRLQSGAQDDPVALEPLYLRSGQVEMAEKTWTKA